MCDTWVQCEFVSARLPVAYGQASLTGQEVIFSRSANEKVIKWGFFFIFPYGESSFKGSKCITLMSIVNLEAVPLRRNKLAMCTVIGTVFKAAVLNPLCNRNTA